MKSGLEELMGRMDGRSECPWHPLLMSMLEENPDMIPRDLTDWKDVVEATDIVVAHAEEVVELLTQDDLNFAPFVNHILVFLDSVVSMAGLGGVATNHKRGTRVCKMGRAVIAMFSVAIWYCDNRHNADYKDGLLEMLGMVMKRLSALKNPALAPERNIPSLW